MSMTLCWPLAERTANGVFDGRDVSDASEALEAVQGYRLTRCPYCAALRPNDLPFCCEWASTAWPAQQGGMD